MTKSRRRKIEWYISLPHVDSGLAKTVIRELLDEIDELEKKADRTVPTELSEKEEKEIRQEIKKGGE